MKNNATINNGNYHRNIGSLCWRALCALLLLVTIFNLRQTVAAQTLEDFGYGRLKVNGKEALGARPLLVILTEHAESPALAHDRDYYDNLIFNYFAKEDNGNLINNLNG